MSVPKVSPFLKHNFVYFTGSLVVSAINYLYYPVMSRLLNPADFGEVQTIISLFTQVAVFLQVLALVSVGIINKYQDESEHNKLITELSRLSFFLSSIVFILSIFFAPLLVTFFRFRSIAPFIALGLSLLISVPLSFANSYLQGHHRFGVLARSNLISAVSKLVFAIILVVIGFRTLGAVAGLLIAQLLALLYALFKGRGIVHFIKTSLRFERPRLGLIKPELPYALMVLCTSLTTNLLLSLDILVIKHYFPPQEAGLYTGVSIISNIIYFLTTPLAMVLMPAVKPSQSPAENHRFLWRSIGLCVAIGGSALAVFVALPRLVILILLGSRNLPYAQFLPKLSAALFILSLANLFIYYNIALRRYIVAPMVLLGLGTTLWLLSHSHASLGAVVNGIFLGAIATAVFLAVIHLIPRRRRTT